MIENCAFAGCPEPATNPTRTPNQEWWESDVKVCAFHVWDPTKSPELPRSSDSERASNSHYSNCPLQSGLGAKVFN